jgi:hypothetical protein
VPESSPDSMDAPFAVVIADTAHAVALGKHLGRNSPIVVFSDVRSLQALETTLVVRSHVLSTT